MTEPERAIPILVIEDSTPGGQILQRMLSPFAHVEIAETFEIGIEKLRRRTWFFVISDFHLGVNRDYIADAKEVLRQSKGADVYFISADPSEIRGKLEPGSYYTYGKDELEALAFDLKEKCQLLSEGGRVTQVKALSQRMIIHEALSERKLELQDTVVDILEKKGRKIIREETGAAILDHWRKAGNVDNITSEIDFDAANHAYQLGRFWRTIKKHGIKGILAIVSAVSLAVWNWIKNPFSG